MGPYICQRISFNILYFLGGNWFLSRFTSQKMWALRFTLPKNVLGSSMSQLNRGVCCMDAFTELNSLSWCALMVIDWGDVEI